MADWDAEPYNSFKKVIKKIFKPSKDQLWNEIKACAKALDVALLMIKSRGMDVKKVWLVENPRTNVVDVAFLLEKEAHFMEKHARQLMRRQQLRKIPLNGVS